MITQWIYLSVTAAMCSCGFALIFHLGGKNIIAASFGGALNWFIYLVVYNYYHNIALGCFLGTLGAALAAELFARQLKAPVITLLAPMLIPMVPGGDLYYTTFALVREDMEALAHYSHNLLWELGAMSMGMVVATCLVQTTYRIIAETRKAKEDSSKLNLYL